MPRAKTKVERYTNSDDVHMRLHECILFYKGQPYYAQADGMNLYLCDLEKGLSDVGKLVVHSNDSELIITSPDIGYVNYLWNDKPAVKFFARSPFRRQKASIAAVNILVKYGVNDSFLSPSVSELLQKNFKQMLLGDYPQFGNVMFAIQQGEAYAVSRNFAISFYNKDNILLHYNGEVIGSAQKHGFFSLQDGYNNSVTIQKLANLGIPVA